MINQAAIEKERLQQAALRRALAAKEAQTDVVKLCEITMPDPIEQEGTLYSPQPHHYLLRDIFSEVMQGKIRKVIIAIPPQFGKSTLCKAFLAQHVGGFPWKHLIYCTYNSDFAQQNGGDVRNLIESIPYQLAFPKVKLAKGSKAKDHMMVEGYNGKMAFGGIGGGITGRPADGLVFDDFFKNPEEAASLTIRNKIWEFLTGVVFARCHVSSWQIIVSTRWDHDDPIGRLTDPSNPYYNKEVADQWLVVNIPARMENEHIAKSLGKKVGDALWPERFPLPWLRTQELMNPRQFNSLYMGRPTPLEGAFFKRDQILGYERGTVPKNTTRYLSGDLAVSETVSADKTCIGAWEVDENGILYLMPDIKWGKFDTGVTIDWVIDKAKEITALTFYQEKGVISKATAPTLKKRMQEKKKYFGCEYLPVTGNKGWGASAIRDRMALGMVRFPKFAPWWPAAEQAILKFGEEGGPDDDFVDMMGVMGRAVNSHMKGRGADNVVALIPRRGSPAWFKYCRLHEEASEKKRKSTAGW